MRIIVFGAGGKVGRLVVGELLRRGHQVTAFVHSKSPFSPDTNLEIVKGDIYVPAQIAEAMTGQEMVISCLGSWRTPGKDVLTVGMNNIVSIMKQAGIQRIVSLTGHVAIVAGEPVSGLDRLAHRAMELAADKILHDGENHIRILQASGLAWTVLRSPIMTKQPASAYQLQSRRPLPWSTISRLSVVQAIADQCGNSQLVGQAPFVVDRHR